MAVPILPNSVVTEMAKREHRMHHYLWHGVRNSWDRLTPSQREEIKRIDPAWEPPRPALDRRGNVLRNNNSGEDFLYMHRQMIALVNDILKKTGDPNYPEVEGWKNVPPPGDEDYPVPPPPFPGLEQVKSDDYFYEVMEPWERQYKSREYLRSSNLGQLGADVEFTIHNNMHMRFCAPSSVSYRPATPITQKIDTQWDEPAYDFLGDTYSSHVNPTFWKLHGWVDDRINDWVKENGVTGEIPWKGTWEGAKGHHHMMSLLERAKKRGTHKTRELTKLEKIANVLADAGTFDGFFRLSSVI